MSTKFLLHRLRLQALPMMLLPIAALAADDNTLLTRVTSDSLSTVVVVLPDGLAAQLMASPGGNEATDEQKSDDTESVTTRKPAQRSVGYRVQIYSDNNQRTARAEAERRASAIRSHFPEYQAYVVFQSPYWRVRVGDFRSRSQAEDAVQQMRQVLPAYGKEMRVVKDRINVD